MSLSARIVLRPSRRLAAGEAVLVIGGALVAAAALVERWPSAVWVIAALASTSLIGLAFAVTRRSPPVAGHAITLSDGPEVGVMPLYDHVPVEAASWRIVEPTLVWPAFAVLGLRAGHGARLVLPVVNRELADGDRRSLQRFLLWTLRGGPGHHAAPPGAE
jgi:drug/metabolite transporter (DMT)-like permease